MSNREFWHMIGGYVFIVFARRVQRFIIEWFTAHPHARRAV